MNYRTSPAKVELPPTGLTVQRSEISERLRARLEKLATAHAAGRTTEAGEGQARTVRFDDGTVWFPRGIEKDNPAIYPVLGFGVAGLALVMLSFDAAGEPGRYPYWLPAGAVAALAAARLFWNKSRKALDNARKRIAMGTLLMEDGIALLAYDEIEVLPKDRIEGFEIVEQRSSEHRSRRLNARFVNEEGTSTLRYLGFVYGSDRQKAETEAAQEVLTEWLAEDEDEDVATATSDGPEADD